MYTYIYMEQNFMHFVCDKFHKNISIFELFIVMLWYLFPVNRCNNHLYEGITEVYFCFLI